MQKETIRRFVTVAVLTAAAAFVYGTMSGVRSNYGIMLGAIVANAGLTYGSVSFVLAVVITFAIIGIVNVMLSGKIDKIHMAESLKSVE